MYLKDITAGTEFNVLLADGTKLVGEHDGNIDHLKFYLHCPDIVNNISELAKTMITIEYTIKDSIYSFTAEVIGKSERTVWGRETVDMVIKTPIKETSRREDFRVNIGVKVRIFSFTNNRERFYTGEQLCEAISDDLSKNGARIWSDRFLDVPPNTMFTLEFAQPLRSTHIIPARLVRSQQNTTTRTYNYDYGFAFDFPHSTDQQDKLVVDALEAKLRGVR